MVKIRYTFDVTRQEQVVAPLARGSKVCLLQRHIILQLTRLAEHVLLTNHVASN